MPLRVNFVCAISTSVTCNVIASQVLICCNPNVSPISNADVIPTLNAEHAGRFENCASNLVYVRSGAMWQSVMVFFMHICDLAHLPAHTDLRGSTISDDTLHAKN